MSIEAKLDAVTKARASYVLARATLEARLQDQLKAELMSLQTQLDIAVRYAFDAGATKASILRAMGLKDFNTLQASLARTEGISEVVGDDPLDALYAFNEQGLLVATYHEHGPMAISGMARFDIKTMEDGTIWFFAHDKLWNDNYTVRNEVVAALDGRQDGFYYNEALQWYRQQGAKQ